MRKSWKVILMILQTMAMGNGHHLPDNICCSVHTLLWTAAARIFVALDFVQLHKIPLLQSIQRWTFCKDIAFLVILPNVIIQIE